MCNTSGCRYEYGRGRIVEVLTVVVYHCAVVESGSDRVTHNHVNSSVIGCGAAED